MLKVFTLPKLPFSISRVFAFFLTAIAGSSRYSLTNPTVTSPRGGEFRRKKNFSTSIRCNHLYRQDQFQTKKVISDHSWSRMEPNPGCYIVKLISKVLADIWNRGSNTCLCFTPNWSKNRKGRITVSVSHKWSTAFDEPHISRLIYIMLRYLWQLLQPST